MPTNCINQGCFLHIACCSCSTLYTAHCMCILQPNVLVISSYSAQCWWALAVHTVFLAFVEERLVRVAVWGQTPVCHSTTLHAQPIAADRMCRQTLCRGRSSLSCLPVVLQYHPLTRSFSQGNRNSGSGERVLSPQSSYKSNQEAAADEAAEQQQPQTPRDLRVGETRQTGDGGLVRLARYHCPYTAYKACPVGLMESACQACEAGCGSRNRQQCNDFASMNAGRACLIDASSDRHTLYYTMGCISNSTAATNVLCCAVVAGLCTVLS
jgi:hypothetical protein